MWLKKKGRDFSALELVVVFSQPVRPKATVWNLFSRRFGGHCRRLLSGQHHDFRALEREAMAGFVDQVDLAGIAPGGELRERRLEANGKRLPTLRDE